MRERDTCMAVLDILGFGSMVRSERDVVDFKDRYMSVFTDGAVVEKARNLDISYEIFSDTVFLGSEGENTQTQIFHVCAFSRFLWTWGLINFFPLRGALSYGTVLWEDDVKVGAPIVEAARLEKLQNWIGIVAGPSVVLQITREGEVFRDRLERDHLILVDVPVKPAGSYKAFALRPDLELLRSQGQDLKAVVAQQQLIAGDIRAQEKYSNTMALLAMTLP